MAKKTRRKTNHALDRYCMFCIVFFVIYTIAEITISSVTGITHDRLTEAIQWFCAGELFFCAMLKRLKIKKEADTIDDTNRELESSTDIGASNSRCN